MNDGTAVKHGRLQRPPGAGGYRVETFSDVVKRHGVTMACLAALCLLTPGAWYLVTQTSQPFLQRPLPYGLALLAMCAFFFFWSRRRSATLKRQSQWLLYLLLISIVEELTFRLIFPSILEVQVSTSVAHIISSLIFAGIHYVTLRWRFSNCVFTFLGAMGLSHLMAQGDLALVIMAHWVGTFLNTPWPPRMRLVPT